MSSALKGAVIAYDYSSDHLSVALSIDGEVVADISEYREQDKTDRLLPMIDLLTAKYLSSKSELTAVACTTGPGSFTSLRVSCAVAQALSLSLGIPVYTVNTYAVTVMNMCGLVPEEARVHVVQPAYKGEYYHAVFIKKDGFFLQHGDIVSHRAEKAGELIMSCDYLMGKGVSQVITLLGEAKPDYLTPEVSPFADAVNIIRLMAQSKSEYVRQVQQVLPHYIRPPEADLNYRKKHWTKQM